MSAAPGQRAAAAHLKPRPRWGVLAAVAAAVLVLDQLTKWWAVEALDDGHIVDLVWTLRFKLAYNTGAAFSLNEGRGALISVIALVVVALLLRSGRHATRPLAALALGLVLGGAVGNLTDRALRDAGGEPRDGFLGGAVVDFVDLQWWPIFNLADSAIVCGALLLIVTSWRDESADLDPADAAEVDEADEARDAGSRRE